MPKDWAEKWCCPGEIVSAQSQQLPNGSYISTGSKWLVSHSPPGNRIRKSTLTFTLFCSTCSSYHGAYTPWTCMCRWYLVSVNVPHNLCVSLDRQACSWWMYTQVTLHLCVKQKV